jgi:hypothetical protein
MPQTFHVTGCAITAVIRLFVPLEVLGGRSGKGVLPAFSFNSPYFFISEAFF